jgi:hypothetical protein
LLTINKERKQMKRRDNATAITPMLTKDVSFSEQVEAVTTALKSRAAAQRDIKQAWATVVQVLNKYEVDAPHRRVHADQVAVLVQKVKIYQPKPEPAGDLKEILENADVYEINRLVGQLNTMRLLDAKLPGIRKLLEDIVAARDSMRQSPGEDTIKTKAARAELMDAITAYSKALEDYDETLESVTGVKEYIGIMKDIAGIAAIGQGIKAKD